MTRTTAREIAIQLGFAAAAGKVEPQELFDSFFSREHYATLAAEDELYSEYPGKSQLDYIRNLTYTMADRRQEIDEYIERYAIGWKSGRISKTALAVLRCAVCEILFMDVPPSAAINEAVELAKGYDEPETVAFINGVLGGFVRGEFSKPQEPDGTESVETAEPLETTEAGE